MTFNPDATPSEPTSPTAGPNLGNPRYVHLVQRLRERQITMEEATELFGMMQGMLRQAMTRPAARAPPGNRPGPAVSAPTAPAMPGGDDLLWLAILGAGAGAGILAAIAKRATEGAMTPRPGSAPPASRNASR